MNKSKGGAKGKYTEWLTNEGLLKIEGWARDGLTNEQIAQNIGITQSTLYDWQKKYSEISEALKRGKDIIDRQVENALLKRALGYEYTERTYIQVDMKGEEFHAFKTAYMNRYKLEHPEATAEELRLVELQIPRTKSVLDQEKTKEVIPDTTAQIFWLKNRKPNEWRDKQQVEHSGEMNVNNPMKELTTAELKELINKLD